MTESHMSDEGYCLDGRRSFETISRHLDRTLSALGTCAYYELRYGDKLETAPRMVSLLGQLERLG